ncbi:MAG: hypothetical protein JSU63_21830 [Phycisphaerales bacterium]|nr:MAG: hypothetical protein JSU63_21830 [Phycisphaerales bacterium]
MIEKALPRLLSNFDPNGGASFRCNEPFRYGHDLMYTDSNVSAIFTTWFRMLTVAYCCEFLKSENAGFADLSLRFPDFSGSQYPVDPHTGKVTPG